ncbi:MAG TPA: hypothetical protein VEG34_19125, partial [Thermoanaerobaculia bacterium]|nr:hypothetical protein [Thermoanaerobaculia bacterium]
MSGIEILSEARRPDVERLGPGLQDRLDGLVADLASRGSALVAFSGGVDSGVVAALAYRALGAQAVAVTAAAETLAG